jgi:hypothetical protein
MPKRSSRVLFPRRRPVRQPKRIGPAALWFRRAVAKHRRGSEPVLVSLSRRFIMIWSVIIYTPILLALAWAFGWLAMVLVVVAFGLGIGVGAAWEDEHRPMHWRR